MAIEPISHNVLVHMLKYRFGQTGLSITGASQRTHIPPSEIVAILEGQMMATPSHLARLALIFEMKNWDQLAAGYALWLFKCERIKASKLVKPGRAETIFRSLEVCSEIIAQNPHKDAETLTDEIHQHLLLDKGAIRNQIAHVRGQPGGHYNYG